MYILYYDTSPLINWGSQFEIVKSFRSDLGDSFSKARHCNESFMLVPEYNKWDTHNDTT